MHAGQIGALSTVIIKTDLNSRVKMVKCMYILYIFKNTHSHTIIVFKRGH